jgi:serine acetyltransferase
MVIFGDFQRDKASQIGAHSIIFSSAPAEKTALQIGMHGVNREHPCGSTGTLQFPITT